MFQPELSFWYSTLGKFLVSIVAVLILGRQTFFGVIKSSCVFWLISTAMGGIIVAISIWTPLGRNLNAVSAGSGVYFDIDFGILFMGILIAYTLLIVFKRSCIRNFEREKILVKMVIYINGERVETTTLLDTGCEMTAPLSGEGVMLISRKI